MSKSGTKSNHLALTTTKPSAAPTNVAHPEPASYHEDVPHTPIMADAVDLVVAAKKKLIQKRRAAFEEEMSFKRKKMDTDEKLDEAEVKIFEIEHKYIKPYSLLSIIAEFKEYMTTQLQDLKTEFQGFKTEFRDLDIKLTRNTNLTLSGFNRPCQVMVNRNGDAPGPDYPVLTTADAVRGLTTTQLRTYCRFYGLPTDGGSDGMRKRLLDHLGILSSVVRSVLETVQ